MKDFFRENPVTVGFIIAIIALCIIGTTAIYQGAVTKRSYIENSYEQVQKESSTMWLWQKN